MFIRVKYCLKGKCGQEGMGKGRGIENRDFVNCVCACNCREASVERLHQLAFTRENTLIEHPRVRIEGPYILVRETPMPEGAGTNQKSLGNAFRGCQWNPDSLDRDVVKNTNL